MADRMEPMPLAIIGMACRLPGADDLDDYWNMLVEGRGAIGPIPPDRFNEELHYDPRPGRRSKSYSRIGGVVRRRSPGEATCPLPEALVAQSDPSHVSLLEVAADACRSAGFDPFCLPQRNIGVYIGHTRGSSRPGEVAYGTLIEQTVELLRNVEGFDSACAGQADAVLREIVAEARASYPRRAEDGDARLDASRSAGLIAQAFSLDGPFMSVNAACASGLMALAMAAWAIQLGQIEMAIVGSASYAKSDALVLFSSARSISATGSRPFDADADGLIVSEGYTALLIKPLEQAIADGNVIQAVIRGIGVASDGRGKSLWAPRKEGQMEAVRRAYGERLDVSRLQYIEAHATSTQVGDATEIAALAEALREHLPAGTKIPLGSVKSNIGHTLETAGMAGLIKTVLAMQHGVVPPTINLKILNPQIAWDEVPFFVPTTPVAWPEGPEGQARRAAVNAFGIGGLNVHVVIDQYLPAEAPRFAASSTDLSPIAVIGMGAIFPGASTTEDYWQLLVSGRDPKRQVPAERWNARLGVLPGPPQPWHSVTAWGGFITDFHYDWRKHKIPPKQIACADPLQFMLLEAVDQALRDSGYLEKPFDRRRTGVLVGTQVLGEFTEQLQMGQRLPEFERTLGQVLGRRCSSAARIRDIAERFGDLLLQRMPALTDETGSFTTSTLASRITRVYDLAGGAAAIDAGGASACAALSAAIDMLQTGQTDMMIVAAGQRALGLPTYEEMSLAGLLATDQPKCPWDAAASGLVPGEGVGVVILKRLADTERDGDTVHAVLEGIGAARADSLGKALDKAVQRALTRTGVAPQHVAMVETAAAGFSPVDRQESQAIADRYANREQLLYVSAVAGQIGYTGGASGMASLLKAVLAVKHKELPPVAGLASPAEWLQQHAATLTPARTVTAIPVENANGRLLAGVTSHNLFDLAYHVVLGNGGKVACESFCPGQNMEDSMSTAATSAVCRRFALRTTEIPLSDDCGAPPRAHGAAIILGHNAVADALRRRLEARGTAVIVLPTSQDPDELIATVERSASGRPPTCLILLTAHDAGSATSTQEAQWHDRLMRGVTVPYLVCQKWFQQVSSTDQSEQAIVLALGSMGGRFGFCGQPPRPECGALAGLMKAIARETSRERASTIRSRFVDAAATLPPDDLAQILCRELDASDSPVEVGYADGKRHAVLPVLRPVPQPAIPTIVPRGTWLITGGARGITAVVARELGRRFGLSLHLIGSSPAPHVDPAWRDLSAEQLQELRATVVREAQARHEVPIEAWRRVEKALEIDRNLRSLSESHVKATYHCCDVSDRRAVAEVLAAIRANDGPIEGIVHGAGFESALRFEKKPRRDVERTIASKVGGAAALMELTRDDPIRWFLAFGSISGRFGGVGQTDYSLANEMLAKLVAWYRQERPQCRSTCFHWPSWDEVGMAVRPESKHLKQAHGVSFMPTREGAEHLVAELLAGLPESEVVIADPSQVARFCPSSPPPSAAEGAPPAAAGSPAYRAHIEDWPLIDALPAVVAGQRVVAEVHLDPTVDPFLDHHRFKQRPLLPLVVSLEALAEAAAILHGDARRVISIEDVAPVKTLQFFSDRALVARIQAEAEADLVRCRMTCDFHNRRGQLVIKDQLHLQATIRVGQEPLSSNRSPLGRLSTWSTPLYADREAILHHGPTLRNLPRISLRSDGGQGEIVAPPLHDLTGRRQGTRWILPSAALDACLMACGIFVWRKVTRSITIPAGMRRLQLVRLPRPGEVCMVDLSFRGRENSGSPFDLACFDFALFGDDGSLILQADEYRNTILSEKQA